MLINIIAGDWVDPEEVAAIESFKEGEVLVHLKGGKTLTYLEQEDGVAREAARKVNDAREQLAKERGAK